jgi:XTP/dITP diphosphohydrolase
MNCKRIALATANQHKIKEIKAILGGDFCFYSAADFPGFVMPPEDGDNFAANALIKAEALCRISGMVTLADDSGLMVAALDCAPGIYSARYSGLMGGDAANNQKLLTEMANVPAGERQAEFRCAVAVCTPEEKHFIVEGSCTGEITFISAGTDGFGYDPLFYLPEYGCTMAELPQEMKNTISHRSRALTEAMPVLQKIFAGD